MRGDDLALSDALTQVEDLLDDIRRCGRDLNEELAQYVKLVDARLAERDARIAELEEELSR